MGQLVHVYVYLNSSKTKHGNQSQPTHTHCQALCVYGAVIDIGALCPSYLAMDSTAPGPSESKKSFHKIKSTEILVPSRLTSKQATDFDSDSDHSGISASQASPHHLLVFVLVPIIIITSSSYPSSLASSSPSETDIPRIIRSNPRLHLHLHPHVLAQSPKCEITEKTQDRIRMQKGK